MDLGNSSDWLISSKSRAMLFLERNGWTLGDTIYAISEIMLGILTVLVNALVPLALWHYKQLRSRANYYICSLAVTDILEGLCVPTLATISHAGLPNNFYGCVFINCILTVLSNVTVLSLVCIAFDRFLSINSPWYHLYSSTPISVAILTGGAWVVGTLNGLIPLIGLHEDPQGFTICSYRAVIPLSYSVYVNFLGFLVPILFLVMIFHLKMLFSFQEHNRRMSQKFMIADLFNKKARRRLARQREMKLTKTLSLIFVMFAVCYFPLQIISCIRMWSPDTHISFDLIKFTIFLSHVNPLINPVIYTFHQPGFKNVLQNSLLAHCSCLLKSSTLRVSSKPRALSINIRNFDEGKRSVNNEDELFTTASSVGIYSAFASSITIHNFDEQTQNGECLMQGPNSDLAEKELVETGKNPSLSAVNGTAQAGKNPSEEMVRKTSSLVEAPKLPFEVGPSTECKDNGKKVTLMSSICQSERSSGLQYGRKQQT